MSDILFCFLLNHLSLMGLGSALLPQVPGRMRSLFSSQSDTSSPRRSIYGLTCLPVTLVRLRTLFAIYRFYTDGGMDVDEDIPGLLVGNTTPEERRVIAGWLRDALTHKAAWSSSQRYKTLLAALEQAN